MCLPANVYIFSSWHNWMHLPKATSLHFFKIRFNNIPLNLCVCQQISIYLVHGKIGCIYLRQLRLISLRFVLISSPNLF